MSSAWQRTISLILAATAGAAFVYFALPQAPSTASISPTPSQPVGMKSEAVKRYAVQRDLRLDEIVRASLVDLGVSDEQIGRGVFRLSGEQWATAPTRALVDFTLPRTVSEASFWLELSEKLTAAGLGLAKSKSIVGESRARFKALTKSGKPLLILRAYPAGPRVSVIVDGVGHEPGLLERLLALDEDVTFSLDTNGPFAAAISKALIAQRREIIAHIPAKQTKEKVVKGDGGQPVWNSTELDDWLDNALARLSNVNGIDTRGLKPQGWSPRDMQMLLKTLGQRGYYLFDSNLIPEQQLEALTHQSGVRVGQRTHEVQTPDGIEQTLKGLDSTLAYSGNIHLSVPATPAVLSALKPWLKSLRDRNVSIMRLSEIVK